ncbi:MAG: hypothetical protein TEF_11945 [Rhizobiales bacterium NRL2]|jgi:protein SCO1/2|nr:MAG: hypothetical protein TEF_11945 [Rhizobiales bacterium NRL2]
MQRHHIFALIVLVIAAVIGISAIIVWQSRSGERVAGAVNVTKGVEIGGPFTMTDHRGREVTEAMLQGRHALIYFGYTFCPDVCPTELQDMAVALDLAGEAGEKVLPVFVTIDPARDGQQEMAAYVEAFHPRMVGLRGTDEQTAAMARAYRVFYAPVNREDEYYLMDHSNFIFLMGPDGDNIAIFNGQASPETIAAGIRQAVDG